MSTTSKRMAHFIFNATCHICGEVVKVKSGVLAWHEAKKGDGVPCHGSGQKPVTRTK